MAIDLEKFREAINATLSKVDTEKVTEEGIKTELPDGYYLCEIKSAELTESKNHNLMVAIQFTTTEDGQQSIIDEDGFAKTVPAPNTKDKIIYQNYVISNEMNAGFFIADMLKFEDPESNTPIFDKDSDFADIDAIANVCDILNQYQPFVYIMVSTVESKDEPGKTEKKYKPISWKRAQRLELI